MARFRYEGFDASGGRVTGTVEAEALERARSDLGARGVLLSERAGAHPVIERVAAAWSAERPADCYRVPKADGQAMIALAGTRAFELLAKMSPVDFRPQVFPPGSIAQTTCARVSR